MAASSVNPFLSDSDEESERKSRRGKEVGAPGLPLSAAHVPTLPLSPQQEAGFGYSGGGVREAAVGLPLGAEPPRVPLDTIAAQLLRDQYILTALEFHTELQEAGRELPRLRDYFSNPGNFERHTSTPPKDLAPAPGQL
eukprot:g22215.t1